MIVLIRCFYNNLFMPYYSFNVPIMPYCCCNIPPYALL
nr:MAG TPA: hypothetical protein [Caudoviricetes sp.]